MTLMMDLFWFWHRPVIQIFSYNLEWIYEEIFRAEIFLPELHILLCGKFFKCTVLAKIVFFEEKCKKIAGKIPPKIVSIFEQKKKFRQILAGKGLQILSISARNCEDFRRLKFSAQIHSKLPLGFFSWNSWLRRCNFKNCL